MLGQHYYRRSRCRKRDPLPHPMTLNHVGESFFPTKQNPLPERSTTDFETAPLLCMFGRQSSVSKHEKTDVREGKCGFGLRRKRRPKTRKRKWSLPRRDHRERDRQRSTKKAYVQTWSKKTLESVQTKCLRSDPCIKPRGAVPPTLLDVAFVIGVLRLAGRESRLLGLATHGLAERGENSSNQDHPATQRRG